LYDNVSEWTSSCFDEAKYMQHPDNTADNQIDNIIVKGKNYKNSMKKDKLVLNGNESYDYVGLRYVRTYLGDKYGKN